MQRVALVMQFSNNRYRKEGRKEGGRQKEGKHMYVYVLYEGQYEGRMFVVGGFEEERAIVVCRQQMVIDGT